MLHIKKKIHCFIWSIQHKSFVDRDLLFLSNSSLYQLYSYTLFKYLTNEYDESCIGMGNGIGDVIHLCMLLDIYWEGRGRGWWVVILKPPVPSNPYIRHKVNFHLSLYIVYTSIVSVIRQNDGCDCNKIYYILSAWVCLLCAILSLSDASLLHSRLMFRLVVDELLQSRFSCTASCVCNKYVLCMYILVYILVYVYASCICNHVFPALLLVFELRRCVRCSATRDFLRFCTCVLCIQKVWITIFISLIISFSVSFVLLFFCSC